MNREAVLNEIEKMVEIEPRYMMGTNAFHQLGDISSDNFDLFVASNETTDNWIGSWVTGFGFFNVVFPKSTSRDLTSEEIEKYNKTYIRINNQPAVKLNISKHSIMEYKIISSEYASTLVMLVNNHIKIGWLITGGVAVDKDLRFYQAMYKNI